jgi:hypothetical protein
MTKLRDRAASWLDQHPDWWLYPAAIAVILFGMIVAIRLGQP